MCSHGAGGSLKHGHPPGHLHPPWGQPGPPHRGGRGWWYPVPKDAPGSPCCRGNSDGRGGGGCMCVCVCDASIACPPWPPPRALLQGWIMPPPAPEWS